MEVGRRTGVEVGLAVGDNSGVGVGLSVGVGIASVGVINGIWLAGKTPLKERTRSQIRKTARMIKII